MIERHAPHGALALLVLLALACGGIGPAPDEGSAWTPVPTGSDGTNGGSEAAVTTAPATAGAASREEPAGIVQLSDADPGLICVGTPNGVTCLDPDGMWTTYTRDDSPLGGNSIYATDVCSDGAILLAHVSGVSRFDGSEWREVEDGWGSGSADGVACDLNGDIWVAHYQGVSRFDGSWESFPAADLALAEPTDLVEAVAAAPDGPIWVATASSVAVWDGGGWLVYDEENGFGERLFVEDLVVDSHGKVWALHSRGLALFADGRWAFPEAPGFGFSFTAIAVDGAGQAWTGTLSDGIMAYRDGLWNSFTMESGDLPSNEINDVAVDGSGRIWAATSYGLSVFDGTAWRTYQMHTAPLADNTIETIAVVAGGPPLPDAMPVPDGAIAGRFFDADGTTPLSGITVEICPENVAFISFDSAPPCAGQPLMLRAETDADGRFRIEGVPTGLYSVTAEVGKAEWANLTGDLGFNERVRVPAGETRELGDLFLSEDD